MTQIPPTPHPVALWEAVVGGDLSALTFTLLEEVEDPAAARREAENLVLLECARSVAILNGSPANGTPLPADPEQVRADAVASDLRGIAAGIDEVHGRFTVGVLADSTVSGNLATDGYFPPTNAEMGLLEILTRPYALLSAYILETSGH